MSAPLVERIADAVLYEGYLLYPYRSSAVKNRQRWNFGVVYPREYSEFENGAEPFQMATECLAAGDSLTTLSVKVRCLRLVERQAGTLAHPGDESSFAPAASIEIEGDTYESWQEAAGCDINLPEYSLAELRAQPVSQRVHLPATRSVEPLHNAAGRLAGLIVRTQEPIDCSIDITLDQPQSGLYRIVVRISNLTPLESRSTSRDTALARSLLSAHAILRVQRGEFISLLEPPPQFQEAAASCRNSAAWPVLAGDPGQRDTLLCSPIILYDYPQIAPESPGDLFDAAEIDEILSLRILTLTDDEKNAMRRSDQRARQILERTETLPPEHFMKLHGALRTLSPTREEMS